MLNGNEAQCGKATDVRRQCCGYLATVFGKQQAMNAATCSGFFLSGFFLSGFSLAVLRTAYFDEISRTRGANLERAMMRLASLEPICGRFTAPPA
jgi:hypothetical protein